VPSARRDTYLAAEPLARLPTDPFAQRLLDATRIHHDLEQLAGDVQPGADRLTARFPTIPGITGMVREGFIAEAAGLLGDSNIEELSEERS